MSEKNNDIIEIDESSLDPKDEKSQLTYTQTEAYKDLSISLIESLKEKRSKKFQRKHNTIFINGKRGSGKTQFLLSIDKNIRKEIKKENNKDNEEFKKLKKLYFFKPIDPTLLHDNENFLTIIVAMILNDLEKKSTLKNSSSKKQKEFYNLLNKLSKAIDGTINNKNSNRTSLENIAQDQSSLQLEKYMNDFFYLVLKISSKEKLVILIDDIDMALDKGVEVLEVIRKYLSSSHLIPIITGDIDLYTLILKNHFSSTLKNLRGNDPSQFINTANDYLIKVFPFNRRIKVKTLWELVEDRIVEISFHGHTYKYTRNENLEKEISSKENGIIINKKLKN